MVLTLLRYVLPVAVVVALTACAGPKPVVFGSGTWRAWLDSPGGELPFGLELRDGDGGYEAWIVNGPERVAVPEVTFSDGELVLQMPHYDSRVVLAVSADGVRLDGEWTKRSGPETWSRLEAHASLGNQARFAPVAASGADTSSISGRWSVKFSSEELPAVGLFDAADNGIVVGTFLTATGDYRYLAGNLDGDRLRLSCFDGAHAFMFDATLDDDGRLSGDFWSRDTWHETWTATRDPDAALDDAFGLTRWTGAAALDELVFPDLYGVTRSLADATFDGDARILEIFGTWCPNCNDASALTVELYERYRDRGLSVVGLAFEISGEFDRDAEQVRIYAERHGIDYPILIAGLHDKAEASKAFPVLDRVRAYPTFVFMDGNGEIRAIYTGFSGPATGTAHTQLREQFDTLIEDLLP